MAGTIQFQWSIQLPDPLIKPMTPTQCRVHLGYSWSPTWFLWLSNRLIATTFSPIGSILFVISTIGNSTVLYLLTKRRLRGPLRIDIMLMHLAIADLMVTFLLMPLEIAWAWTVQWRSTDLMCRLMSFFRVFGLYLSSFVMVCISLDRWVALCR